MRSNRHTNFLGNLLGLTLVIAIPGCKTLETKSTSAEKYKIVQTLQSPPVGTRLYACAQEYGELWVNNEHIWTVSAETKYVMNFSEAVRSVKFVPNHPQLRKVQPSADFSGAARAAYVVVEKHSSGGYFIPLPGAFITGGKVRLLVNFTDKKKFEDTCGDFPVVYLSD